MYTLLFVSSGNMPRRIREFCKKTGQKVPETVGEIICCINQSIALKYKNVLEKIEYCLDKKYDKIHMIGGGIQSKLLCQMAANANNMEVAAGPIEATALGNLAVQFMALGEIKDVQEARKIVANSENFTTYQPQDAEMWDEAYKVFKKILCK